jgi:hypothetical protein
MIYIIVTTCLLEQDKDKREIEYKIGIRQLKKVIHYHPNVQVIIVENNGPRKTFLDDLGFEVFYTINNRLNTTNKGIKELYDICQCIEKYNIGDEDFIVKLTGRYVLTDNSPFMNIVLSQKIDQFDSILRYGSFMDASGVISDPNDCITGLIGMRCKYVKQIEPDYDDSPIELKWADMSYRLDQSRVLSLDQLGIYICPMGNRYRFI